MIIWRVQHKKNGNGPYQQDTKLSSKISSAHCDFAHPHPTGDGIPWTCLSKCYHCGMPTLSSLLDWFEDFIPALDRSCEIVKVEVPRGEYCKGEKQVMFNPKKAVILSRRPLQTAKQKATSAAKRNK